VHVIGAGPVGLLLTALLQSLEGLSVQLYEKGHEYTRTRFAPRACLNLLGSTQPHPALQAVEPQP
jgi:2-polyprenyl-6-methoxyphenol hydroxylase-like FAD-dependent oxidoreductase